MRPGPGPGRVVSVIQAGASDPGRRLRRPWAGGESAGQVVAARGAEGARARAESGPSHLAQRRVAEERGSKEERER